MTVNPFSKNLKINNSDVALTATATEVNGVVTITVDSTAVEGKIADLQKLADRTPLLGWQGAVAGAALLLTGAVLGTYVLAPAMGGKNEVDVNVTPMRAVGGSK